MQGVRALCLRLAWRRYDGDSHPGDQRLSSGHVDTLRKPAHLRFIVRFPLSLVRLDQIPHHVDALLNLAVIHHLQLLSRNQKLQLPEHRVLFFGSLRLKERYFDFQNHN